MRIADLLSQDLDVTSLAAPAEDILNPFLQADALQEAQLLDLRFDAKTGDAALIFELRVSLEFGKGNTGVLVLHGVRSMQWQGPSRETHLTAWSVGRSTPRVDDQSVSLEFAMWPAPGAHLTVTGADATFVECSVPGLTSAPPDYSELTARQVTHKLAGWQSNFAPLSIATARPIAPTPYTAS
jgi:hypothetical protein